MHRVWKYDVHWGTNILSMPRNPKFLTMTCQQEYGKLWALVDTAAEMVDYTVDFVYTGAPAPSESKGFYIGQLVYPDRTVLHGFYMREGQ